MVKIERGVERGRKVMRLGARQVAFYELYIEIEVFSSAIK